MSCDQSIPSSNFGTCVLIVIVDGLSSADIVQFIGKAVSFFKGIVNICSNGTILLRQIFPAAMISSVDAPKVLGGVKIDSIKASFDVYVDSHQISCNVFIEQVKACRRIVVEYRVILGSRKIFQNNSGVNITVLKYCRVLFVTSHNAQAEKPSDQAVQFCTQSASQTAARLFCLIFGAATCYFCILFANTSFMPDVALSLPLGNPNCSSYGDYRKNSLHPCSCPRMAFDRRDEAANELPQPIKIIAFDHIRFAAQRRMGRSPRDSSSWQLNKRWVMRA